MKINIWARVGTSMTIDVPDNASPAEIKNAFTDVIRKNNPSKEDFFFDGESYIAISPDTCGLDEDISVEI